MELTGELNWTKLSEIWSSPEFLWLREGLGSMIKNSQNDKKAAMVQINLPAKAESPMGRGGAGLNNFVLQKAGSWQNGEGIKLGATAGQVKTAKWAELTGSWKAFIVNEAKKETVFPRPLKGAVHFFKILW